MLHWGHWQMKFKESLYNPIPVLCDVGKNNKILKNKKVTFGPSFMIAHAEFGSSLWLP